MNAKYFVAGFFLGRWAFQFFAFMVTHPLRFLIGLVRVVLVLAAIIIGVFGSLIYSGSGWAWIVGPILIGLVLLFIQRAMRNWSDAL